jgi:hypothetical protein
MDKRSIDERVTRGNPELGMPSGGLQESIANLRQSRAF